MVVVKSTFKLGAIFLTGSPYLSFFTAGAAVQGGAPYWTNDLDSSKRRA